MFPSDPSLLAAGPGAGDIVEVLIGLAVFVIWVIASIAGAIKKRRGPVEPAESPEDPVIVFEPEPAPMPPPRRKPKQREVRAVAPPPSPPPPAVPPTPPSPYTVRSERPAEAAKPGAPRPAALVHRLLRRDVIRGGVVLSEVLQPPVSLRPPREQAS